MTPGPRAHYFFGTRVAATAHLPFHPYAPSSLAYFCQTCGELWARILVEGSETDWLVEIAPCGQHRGVNALDWTRVPGSLTQGHTRSNLGAGNWARAFDTLPLPLKNREVLAFIHYRETASA